MSNTSRAQSPVPGGKADTVDKGQPSVAGVKFEVKHTFGCNTVQRYVGDPVSSFAMTVGDKDYSDRLMYKVGKHLCIFNPENGEQHYLDRPKIVIDVLHFSISSNNRFVSVCEITRSDRSSETSSQISIYYLVKFNRLKTLQHALPRPFVCSTFCGDGKMLAGLTDDPERNIVIWQWEKEKVYKVVSLSSYGSINLLRSAPSQTLMLTTSGSGILKNWCLASDSQVKPSNFLPAPKEASENFIDHAWLPSSMGVHKMIALADADGGHDHGNIKFRKQAVYIFEGGDNTHLPGTGPAAQSNIPIIMELRQVLTLKLDIGSRMERVISSTKVFYLAGSMGLVGTYEKSDDKHEPYVESRRVSLGDKQLVGGTVYPSEEKMVLITRQGRLLNMPLDVTIEQIKMSSTNIDYEQGGEEDQSVESGDDDASRSRTTLSKRSAKAGHGITDITPGGYHTTSILMADMAFERPLMVTIAGDSTARVWNYRTKKCELNHHFGNDPPIAVAFHSSGFQLLVSFKDRIKMYNVLMNKLRPCREAIVKHCNCLKFSNGSQYFAAASAINVFIFETKSFVQLKQCMGHMNNVYQLSWADGDQVLFSAGQDGNVYGWPVAKHGRIDFITGSRSSPSPVVALDVDAPSTVFPLAPREGDDDSSTTSVSFGGGNDGGGGLLSDAFGPQSSLERSALIISTQDGNMRIANWSLDAATVKTSGGTRPSTSAVNDAVQIVPGEITCYITALQLSADRSKLYAGTSTGTLRVYPWPPPNTVTATEPKPPVGATSNKETSGAISSATLSAAASHAAAMIPSTPQPAQFYEICTHAGPVVAIKVSAVDSVVVSAAADGSVFVHDIREDLGKDKNRTGGTSSTAPRGGQAAGLLDALDTSMLGLADGPEMALNDDVVLMSIEDVEDHLAEVLSLQKELNETKAKNDFHTRKVESDHTETIKKMVEMHDAAINKEKENFEKHRAQFEKRFSDLVSSVEAKEADNQKIRAELENKYEHKLADQLERYDTLSEKMQLLKQECQGLLEKHRNDFQKELNQVRIEGHNREKKLSNEQRRAVEDKKANEDAFKEILRQQETEYEDELKQLIEAANSELVSERDTILKLRTLVQTKNTKLDQMKKKLLEVSNASKARLILLEKERAEKVKLKDTIEHYKDNLREREIALEEKEKIVLELRSTTRTLENFRFVLDHRLQQLSSERGPITKHIEGLEKHISTMYEELVEEFNTKKANMESSQLKDQKIQWITNDLNKMRQSVREKEHYITLFKRELNNIVSSMAVGKELEESVKLLYKKFVRGETGGKSVFKVSDHIVGKVDELMHGGDTDDQTVLSMESVIEKAKRQNGTNAGGGGGDAALVKEVEEALVETAKEADRQKKFVERQTNNLRHRLQCVKRETHTVARHRLNENSNLLFECNHLRTEVRELTRKLSIKSNELDLANRNLELLRSEMRESMKPLSKSSSRIRAAMSTPLPSRPPSQPRPKSPSRAPSIDDLVAGISGIKPLMGSPEDRKAAGNVTGTATGVGPMVLSKSAPQIGPFIMDDENVSGRPGMEMGPRAESDAVLQPVLGSLALQGDDDKANVKHISLNIPRAESMTLNSSLIDKPSISKRKQPLGSGTLFAEKDAQIDRMQKEVLNLAHQLDDSIRERELQRIELSRLRKQVMTMSTIHGSGQTSGGPVQLPSIANGSASVALSLGPDDEYQNRQHGFVPEHSPHSNHLTNADVHGIPSEADKAAMRLGPAATPLGGGGVNAPSSLSSGSSMQSNHLYTRNAGKAVRRPSVGKGALSSKRAGPGQSSNIASIPGVAMMPSTTSMSSESI